MAWCIVLWKAIKVRRAFSRLKQAKRNAYRKALGLPPIYPIYERPFRWIWGMLKILLLNTCCRCCKSRKGVPSSWSKLWRKGTMANEILKAVVGFAVGIVFSKLTLDFLTSHLNFRADIVYWSCIAFGTVLTIGLTFSDTSRCLFALGLPQLFSSKGRAALIAYLIVLAMSGPGKNTAKNMEILGQSLACGQEMVRNSTQELVDLATSPMSALKAAFSVIIESVEGILGRMKSELGDIINTIKDIIATIKRAYEWLKHITDECNDELGTPYHRCMIAFETARNDCKKTMGSWFDWMCGVLDVFDKFCHFAKITDVFCFLPSLARVAVIEPLSKLFEQFKAGFDKFIDVRLNFTYKLDHAVDQDKTLSDIASSIKEEIMGKVSWLTRYLDWMDLVVSGFILLVIWKAFTYRYKYLNSDSYDNYYISRAMIRMDLKRKRIDKASIFPLKYRETKIYVQTFSWALVQEERIHQYLALIFVGIAAVQILNYILIDYLLYLFLDLIRQHGSIKFDTKEALLGIDFAVEGKGFLAEMYRSILNGLSPSGGLLPSFDTSRCLPDPSVPNYYQYAWIGTLLLFCFFLATMEPYGLRLRHIVCGWVYEKRILQREVWLYQHILSNRDGFFDWANSQLRAKFKGDRTVYQVSIQDRLYHLLPCCNHWFKSNRKKCFLCGLPGELDDFEYFVECPNCHLVYCKECYNDMGEKCLGCAKEIGYEELTDFEEEVDSGDDDSDEDRDLIEMCCNRLCNCACCMKKGKKRNKRTRTRFKRKGDSKAGKRTKDRKVRSKSKRKDVKYQKLKQREESRSRSKKKGKSGSKGKPKSKAELKPKSGTSKTGSKGKSGKRKSKAKPKSVKSKSKAELKPKSEKSKSKAELKPKSRKSKSKAELKPKSAKSKSKTEFKAETAKSKSKTEFKPKSGKSKSKTELKPKSAKSKSKAEFEPKTGKSKSKAEVKPKSGTSKLKPNEKLKSKARRSKSNKKIDTKLVTNPSNSKKSKPKGKMPPQKKNQGTVAMAKSETGKTAEEKSKTKPKSPEKQREEQPGQNSKSKSKFNKLGGQSSTSKSKFKNTGSKSNVVSSTALKKVQEKGPKASLNSKSNQKTKSLPLLQSLSNREKGGIRRAASDAQIKVKGSRSRRSVGGHSAGKVQSFDSHPSATNSQSQKQEEVRVQKGKLRQPRSDSALNKREEKQQGSRSKVAGRKGPPNLESGRPAVLTMPALKGLGLLGPTNVGPKSKLPKSLSKSKRKKGSPGKYRKLRSPKQRSGRTKTRSRGKSKGRGHRSRSAPKRRGRSQSPKPTPRRRGRSPSPSASKAKRSRKRTQTNLKPRPRRSISRSTQTPRRKKGKTRSPRGEKTKSRHRGTQTPFRSRSKGRPHRPRKGRSGPPEGSRSQPKIYNYVYWEDDEQGSKEFAEVQRLRSEHRSRAKGRQNPRRNQMEDHTPSRNQSKRGRRGKREPSSGPSKSRSKSRPKGTKGRKRQRTSAQDYHCPGPECPAAQAWWERERDEPFRQPPKHISPKIKGKVDFLNEFYEGMPYPPHCNL